MDAICHSQQLLAMQMCSLQYDMTMLCSIANELRWGLSILIASYLELQLLMQSPSAACLAVNMQCVCSL